MKIFEQQILHTIHRWKGNFTNYTSLEKEFNGQHDSFKILGKSFDCAILGATFAILVKFRLFFLNVQKIYQTLRM